MAETPLERPPARLGFAWLPVLLLVALKLLVHGLTSGSYGFFRDELYFLDCARHPQWGYVDDAPGIVWIFKAALLMGGSLPVVRILAAIGGAATVFSSSLLAWEMGGNRFAQGLAGLCVLSTPIFLGMDSILCVGSYEPLFWMGCVWLAIRIARTRDTRLWLAFGLVAGLGLQMKYTMLLVLACFLVALALTPLRDAYRRAAFWGGAALAVLIFLPALFWQIQNHFPLLEDMANIRRLGKNVELGPLAFIREQIVMLNPLLLPLWGAGLVFLFRRVWLRVLAWFYLLLLAAMIALHAKAYYLAAIYPMLFAAGAVAIEDYLESGSLGRGRAWAKGALTTLVAVLTLLLIPAILPILSPQRLLAYQGALGIKASRTEVAHDAPLEQRLSDQFGWPELAEETAAIYLSLTPEERRRTAIFAENYGEAGAINQFGLRLGLPAAVCAHQAHSFWGPPAVEFDTFICLGCGRDGLDRAFESVIVAGRHDHPWGMAFENHPIYLCRGLRTPLKEIWPRIRHWD